jgi:hypothetical protein
VLKAGRIQEGSVVFGVQTKLEPLLSGALKMIKNGLELRKLWAPKVKGVKTSKKQTTECYKADSQSPKKFFVCCSVVIRVPR